MADTAATEESRSIADRRLLGSTLLQSYGGNKNCIWFRR